MWTAAVARDDAVEDREGPADSEISSHVQVFNATGRAWRLLQGILPAPAVHAFTGRAALWRLESPNLCASRSWIP